MKVLLARPHDFLVDEMRAWLTSLGVEPVRLQSIDQLVTFEPATVAGIVISVAVTSVVAEGPGAALLAVRRRFPSKPVIVAGMAALASARAGLAAEFDGATLHGPTEDASWGTPGVLLYVSGDDLRTKSAALAAVARRHLLIPRSPAVG
jgi:hypothetical protein